MAAISLSELERMERMVRIAEITVTFFRYIPVIIGVMACISLILAGLNFAEGSYGWAVVNLILGALGVLFVIRVSRPNPRHFAKESDVAH
jgi:hypothetical protein